MTLAPSSSPLTHPCRWGILGLSQIALNYAIEAIKALPDACLLQAVASTNAAKRAAWAAQNPSIKAYADYELLLQDPAVDAIYLSLPHALHAPWALKAINAGKHLLIEKPLALDPSQAQQIFQAAQRQQVLVWEGFMWRHQKCLPELVELTTNIHHPWYLGELKEIRGIYSFYEANIENPAKAEQDFRLQDAFGGGALHDIGTYLLNLVRLWALPAKIKAHSVLFPGTKTVDQATQIILTWPSGGRAVLSCSYDTGFGGQEVDLIFRHGKIHWPRPFNPLGSYTYQVFTEASPDPQVFSGPQEDLFQAEFRNFSQAFQGPHFT